MENQNIKRSGFTIHHHSSCDGNNEHRDYNDQSRHNRNRQDNVPPPWERPSGALYSDRERMRNPRRDHDPFHHSEFPPHNNRYRGPPITNQSGYEPIGGRPAPPPPPYGPPMDRRYHYERRGSFEGFHMDVTGSRIYHRDERYDDTARMIPQAMEDVKYSPPTGTQLQRGQPILLEQPQRAIDSDQLKFLKKEDIFPKLVRLGDVKEHFIQHLTELSESFLGSVFHPILDPEEFKDITSDYHLPSKPGLSTHRKMVEQNIITIATSISECATYLPIKSGYLASVVAECGIRLTRPPDDISMADVEAATIAPEVKPDPSDEGAIDRKAKTDEFRLKRDLLNCLIKSIISDVMRCLNECLSSGKIIESMNLLRFVMELTNCHIVQPVAAIELIQWIIDLAKEIVAADAKDSLYVEPLIAIAVGSLPWLSRMSCESVSEKMTSCLTSIDELLAQRQESELSREGLSAVWGSSLYFEDTLLRAQRGLRSLRDSASWTSKALWRIYQSGSLAASLTNHYAVIHHTLPKFSFSTQKLTDSLETNRATATRVALGADTGSDFQLAAQGNLGDTQSSYATAAAEMGVGGSTLGLNGCWFSRSCITIWDNSQLSQLLLGVRPLEIHDRWLLEELFLAVLHCFRHTPELCSEMILRIPFSHDQFEAVLVETIFNEMLRLPHSAEPLLFYSRLLDFICQKQRTMYHLVESAILSLSQQCHRWDNQATEILAEFLGFWLSILPDGPASFSAFESWSPEAIRRESHLWHDMRADFVDSTDTIVSLIDRQSQIMDQRLPNSLKLFLVRVFDRLSRVLWSGNFSSKLPPWLQIYIPEESQFRCGFARRYEKMVKAEMEENQMDDDAILEEQSMSNEEEEKCPLEYVLFRKLIQIRFANAQHQNSSILQLAQVLFYRLFGKPPLAQLPSVDYIFRFTLPGELKNVLTSRSAEVVDIKADFEDGNIDGEVEMVSASVSDIVKNEDRVDQITMNSSETHNEETSGTVREIDEDDDVERIDVEHDTVVDAVEVKPEATYFKTVYLEAKIEGAMSVEQRSLHDEALSRTMAEEFIYEQSEGGWSLSSLTEIFMRALLGHGAKTLTHSARVLENYQQLLFWLRPSNPRMELVIPKSIVESFAVGTEADSEYYAALLRSVFSFWKEDPVKCQFVIDKLTRLGIVPMEEVQNFILNRLSMNRIGNLSTQEILFHLVREAIRRLLVQEEELKRIKRTTRFESEEEKKLDSLHEAALSSRHRIRMLVLNCLVETCRRLTQMSSSDVGGFPGMDVCEEEGVVKKSNQEVLIIGTLTKSQQFLECQSIRRLLYYGRTFIQFLDLQTVRFQVSQMNPKAEVAKLLTLLQSTQDFLYPRGISDAFSGYKKDAAKDEEF